MQQFLKMIFLTLITVLLAACGGDGTGSDNPPSPPPQTSYEAELLPAVVNRTDHTVTYTLTCEQNCQGFSKANGNTSNVVLAQGQLLASQPSSTWSNQFWYKNLPANQKALIRLSVTDGDTCNRHQDVVVEGQSGDTDPFVFVEACGEPLTHISASLDNYYAESSMPDGTNELDVKLAANNAQPQLTAAAKSYDIKLTQANHFDQAVKLPIDTNYSITAPSLLNSCDCVASLKNPTTFAPVWSGYNEVALDYQVAPQKLMLTYALTSHYAQDYATLFSTMTKDGYNTALLTGLKFAKDDSGIWQLLTADGTIVDNLIGDSAAGVFPQYMMPVLQIDNAGSITDTTQLTDALWFAFDDKIGVDLVANNASQNVENLMELIQALTGKFSHIHSIDLTVPAAATQDDLIAIIKLKQAFLDTYPKWSGWIKLTSAQLQAVDQIVTIKDPQHWLVDMSDTSAKTTSMADLLKSYQTIATKVNGLMIDDSGYGASDIALLRHAVFLNQYPSSS